MSTVSSSGHPVILFLHIPKAAGLTLYEILDREYGRSRIYTFAGGRQRLQTAVDQFCALPANQQDRYDLLRGHFGFGIHKRIGRAANYITLLREPVDRVISHYHYVKRTPQHALYHQVTGAGMTLADYVSSGINYEMDNGQVRQIAGVNGNLPFGGCSSDLLAQALRNLASHFAVVGQVERFDETLLLLRQKLQWRHLPLYVRQNVTRERPLTQELTPATRSLIERYNSLDCELYESIARQFANELETLPPDELDHFRQWNRRYTPWGQMRARLHKATRKLIRFR